MALFALAAACFILIWVGIGIVLAVLGLFVVFGLVSAGILSTSIIVALSRRSLADGFKTSILLTVTIISTIGWCIFFLLYNAVVHWWTMPTAALVGSTLGLVTGILFGFSLIFIIRRMAAFFRRKLDLSVWGEQKDSYSSEIL
jgi:hypothetical protein